ncbi:unnamed protein product [Fusarium langsethiae]|nr:unnamed protein product [Fusarium langsethiae]
MLDANGKPDPRAHKINESKLWAMLVAELAGESYWKLETMALLHRRARDLSVLQKKYKNQFDNAFGIKKEDELDYAEDYEAAFKPMRDMAKALGHSRIPRDKVGQLANRSGRRFKYPYEKRRTKDTVNALRQAEANLDAVWAEVDGLIKTNMTQFNDLALYQPEQTKEQGQPVADKDLWNLNRPLCNLFLGKSEKPSQKIENPVLWKRKTKAKTKGELSKTQTDNAPPVEVPEPEIVDKQLKFVVDARALKVFRNLFYNPEVPSPPGEIAWDDFLHAMASTGFQIEKLPLSAAASGLNPGQEPSRYLEISQELIKRGVDINDRSGRLGPALRSAAYHGNSDLVQLLLNEGAKVSKSKGMMGTAYEAAHARGHEKVMEMLLEADPSAKEYGENDVAAAHDRQKVQRRIFRATVKASSVNATNNLIREFENFFHKEIRKGATPFLRGLSKLGENCFIDVVSLTTGSAEQPNKEISQLGKQKSSSGLSLLNCFGKENPSEPEADHVGRPRLVLRRATKTFAADGVGEHFQQVLDRMTQAAVKILEDAIENGTKEVIRLIANTWVEALNNLIPRPGYGENMLKVVVQRRANELKGFMSNDDLSAEEKWGKAKALALVGIELLIVAVGRGEKFKRLPFVTSKLWVQAVIDVDSLGKDGASATQQLMGVFAERFLSAVEVKDLAEVEVCGKSGLELLRAATLSGNKSVLGKFSDEWIRCWEFAVQNMDFETEQMILARVMEHSGCNIDEASEGTLTVVELL